MTTHYLGGIRIIEIQPHVDYVQRRRHRRARIDKKWRKRYGYAAVPRSPGEAYVVGNTLFCTREVIDAIKREGYGI